MSQNDISNDEFSMEMERIYMNSMQVMVNLLDPNKVVVEAARASGKTSEVTVNRRVVIFSASYLCCVAYQYMA